MVAGCDVSVALMNDDASTQLQKAIDRLHRNGGGTIRLSPNGSYQCRQAPIVRENVALDLNGSTLELLLGNSNDQGVRLRSGATLCNGTIHVRSRGNPSLQGGAHAPVCIGPLYGEGGTPATPSPDESVTNWTVRDLTLSSDKNVETPSGAVGAVAIQITGNAANGTIKRIVVPDSVTMSGAIHLDWGVIGPIRSAEDPAALEAWRRLHATKESWTTHPHDIAISDIRVGRLTGGQGGPDGGADGIRISGSYNITVSRVRAKATSGVFLRHTAGDLGLEFALAGMAATLSGNRFSDCVVDDCMDGRLFVSDSMADNVERGVLRGYSPRRPPILPTDVIFDGVRGKGNGRANGGVFVQQHGGTALRCRSDSFAIGFLCDADTRDITIANCSASHNTIAGYWIEHTGKPPRDCRLVSPIAFDNGGAAGSANIVIGSSIDTIIDGGVIGATDHRDTASYGVWIKERRDGCIDASIIGAPLVQSHAANGAAFRVSSDEGWGALKLFEGARYGRLVDNQWVGLSIIPVRIDASGNRTFSILPSRRSIVPLSFPRREGDRFIIATTNEPAR